jgi:hypothetical protein
MTLRIIITLLILTLFSSCSNENQSLLLNPKSVEHYKKTIDYDYSVEKVFSYEDEIHLGQIEFFKNGKLIEHIQDEHRAQYFYNDDGKLIKINNCRFNNCDAGNREFMKYDQNGNLIGSLITTDSIVAFDTLTVLQDKFYDDENRLIKELIRKSKVLWKTYTYKNGKINKEFKITENDTLLYGEYFYDDNDRLKRIEKRKDSVYFIERYQYENNNLSKKILKSNQYPLEDNVKFSANNSTTEYYYNANNELIKEIIYDHRGKQYQLIEYKIELKKY